ncbi:MAG: hypothetical protein ACKO3V_01475, partial [Pirellula sp.]
DFRSFGSHGTNGFLLVSNIVSVPIWTPSSGASPSCSTFEGTLEFASACEFWILFLLPEMPKHPVSTLDRRVRHGRWMLG